MAKKEIIVGIDEVGRGPIAGPVAICALYFKTNFTHPTEFKNLKRPNGKLRDSKRLSAIERDIYFEKINTERKKGNIFYKVSLENNNVIDQKGISFAIKRAISKSLRSLKINSVKSIILLDGGLKAGNEYKKQKTIIKGDEKELTIALASIVAKVTRDKIMIKLASKYPNYYFDRHKGYGTKKHYWALKLHGLTPLHRKSFLRKITT